MNNFVLAEAIEYLRKIGLVENEGDFCRNWLGHCDSYLRTIRFKKTEPSLGAIAICASRLQMAGEQMLSTYRYRAIGLRMMALSEKCRAYVNEQAVELDLSL